MIKKTFFSFCALLFAVWLGLFIHKNPGYILVSSHGWTIETSMWFAIAILILAFIILYVLLRTGIKISTATASVRKWLINRSLRRARLQTTLGLYDFAEGNWAAAEKKLLRAAKYSDMPLINYLAAAFMAQHQNALARRDSYLMSAQKIAKNQPIAIGLVQTRLQIGNHQWEEAVATLQHLHSLRPKNCFILQLLVQVYFEIKEWEALKNLLPTLKKHKVFDDQTTNKYELEIYRSWLNYNQNDIEKKWNKLSHYLQTQAPLIAIYAEHLLSNNKNSEAESLLKMALHKSLDNKLLELYAKLPSDNLIKKLSRAEQWLSKHPENAALLLCLGRICCAQKLWGKARHYLEDSARFNANAAVYFELGQLFEKQNDLHKALRYYSKGIQYK